MSVPIVDLIQALSNPEIYPHKPASVSVVQTHASVVFIAGEFVYKIKKPLNLHFLDYSTFGKRTHFCSLEVKLNSRYSTGVYLGVVFIHTGPAGLTLEEIGDPVESALLMRHVPEELLLINQIKTHLQPIELVELVADSIAGFHAVAERNPHITEFGSPCCIRTNLQENFDQTERLIGRTISREIYDGLQAASELFMRNHEDLFQARMSRGYIRDCHGDLHLDHVLMGESVMLLDCIEFNHRFRYGDTASDMAFLLMDLDFQGYREASQKAALRYANAAGDESALKLFPFYKSYRAFVRGKVWGFVLDEPEVAAQAKEAAARLSRDYFALAARLLGVAG